MAVELAGVKLVAQDYSNYMKQMRAINKAHQEAFGTQHVKQFNTAQKSVRTQMQRTQKEASKMGSSLKAMGGRGIIGGIQTLRNTLMSLQSAIPAVAAAMGLIKLIQFGKASVEVAARNETLRVSLETIGDSAGYTTEQIDAATEQLKDQGITTQAAQESLIRMARANISWARASELAQIAQGAAVAAGMNSSEAFNRLILGIQKMEPELLDELGITLRRSEAYKKLAAQLGKNTQALTDQEKQQAIINEVVEQAGDVYKVYDNAMETAGKMQGSLARHIEETQNNIGEMLLPLKTVSITMQTDFWKGARKASEGVKSFGFVLQAFIEDLKGVRKDAEDTRGFFQRFGEDVGNRAHLTARAFMEFAALASGALTGAAQAIEVFLTKWGAAAEAVAQGDFAGAREAIRGTAQEMQEAFNTTYIENAKAKIDDYHERFPELWMDYEELGEVAETSLERASNAVDDNIEALNEQKAALEKQIDVLKRVEDIYDNYQKGIQKAEKKLAKQLDKLAKSQAKAEEKARKKMQDSLLNLEKQEAKEREAIAQEADDNQRRAQKELHRDLEMERKRFQLSQMQALRRFKNQEKWLMAEGDVLALMQARENFDLQQKEAKENFDLQQQERKDTAQDEVQQQQEEAKKRLEELDASIRDRRQQIMDSYNQELADLQEANIERRAELAAQHQEELQNLKDARDEQLKTLAKSLKDEGEITEQGMQEIADIIAGVFGEEGLADTIMQGWAERSQSAVGDAISGIQQQILDIEATMERIESGDAESPETPRRRRGLAGSRGPRRRGRRGMRTGGVGVVTGPALFEVEPGVKEMVAFAPMSSRSVQDVNVNVGGGVDVRGAEGASPFVVDSAVELMVEYIGDAVKRLKKI